MHIYLYTCMGVYVLCVCEFVCTISISISKYICVETSGNAHIPARLFYYLI